MYVCIPVSLRTARSGKNDGDWQCQYSFFNIIFTRPDPYLIGPNIAVSVICAFAFDRYLANAAPILRRAYASLILCEWHFALPLMSFNLIFNVCSYITIFGLITKKKFFFYTTERFIYMSLLPEMIFNFEIFVNFCFYFVI